MPGRSELIRSAIEFDDLEVTDILTPRVDIVAVSAGDTAEHIREIFQESAYTRLPVYKDSVDNIIGVIHLKDFYKIGKAGSVSEIMKPVLFTAQTTKISSLLKRLQNAKTHLAVVVDEYGGTLGIVTLEDILEELVGEIWDEHDEVVKEFEPLSENEYKILGSASLEKTFRMLEVKMEADQATVSGWVSDMLGRIPEKGDTFTAGNLPGDHIEDEPAPGGGDQGDRAAPPGGRGRKISAPCAQRAGPLGGAGPFFDRKGKSPLTLPL